MAEAVLNWATIIAAIKTQLEGVQYNGAAAFQQVIPGEPLGLPLGGPHAAFWYLGRRDSRAGRQTLGNIMYAARIQIGAFWVKQHERDTLAGLDAEIATVDTNIRRAFRGDSTINNNLTDLDITDSEVGFGPSPGISPSIQYRALMFELVLDNLEGEPIAP